VTLKVVQLFTVRQKLSDIIIIIVYYAEAAKPYNTIKHSKNTVKSTEMYKNVIRPRVTAYS